MVGIRQNQKSSIVRKYRQADFMICNSCFWCASNLSLYSPVKCPTCDSDKMELIPISETEAYGLNIDGNGVTMEFWNSD
jgi:hypothetical protein